MVRQLIAGVMDGVRGAAYLVRHRRLFKWVVGPVLVVTLVAAMTFGWLLALVGAVGLVGWTSLAIVCATVIATIAMLIAGPFNELLSKRSKSARRVCGHRASTLRASFTRSRSASRTPRGAVRHTCCSSSGCS